MLAKREKPRAAAAAQKIVGITLILNREEVVKLKGQALQDHLDGFSSSRCSKSEGNSFIFQSRHY